MGFCLLNHVAIAARALQHEERIERVLVFDWDVHHGNGTQHSFEDDASVLYASTHQFPWYPGTGDFDEAGRGAGEGYTLNLPLPAGCGDDEYVGVVQRVLVPVARAYRPEIILVSCGFDAHRDDPLASMQVSRRGFADLATLLRALADELCGGRLVFALEGGYSLLGLREGTDAVLDALLAPETPRVPASVPCPRGSVLSRVVACAAEVHAARVHEIGAA
jgi:acetoin utilization deacetylase AcuC-like enzyme